MSSPLPGTDPDSQFAPFSHSASTFPVQTCPEQSNVDIKSDNKKANFKFMQFVLVKTQQVPEIVAY